MAGKEASSAFSTLNRLNEADSAERKRKRSTADKDQLSLALRGKSSDKDQEDPDGRPKAQHTGLHHTALLHRKAEAGDRNLYYQVAKRVQHFRSRGTS